MICRPVETHMPEIEKIAAHPKDLSEDRESEYSVHKDLWYT